MEDKINRMKELIKLLNKASYAYYQDSAPIMTDYEYDKLYDELVSNKRLIQLYLLVQLLM